MRIFGFQEFGSQDVSTFLDVEEPTLQPGSVLIRPKYVGVNPADIKVRSGQRQGAFPVNFPMAMGREATGVVIAVDPHHALAQTIHPGDWVFGGTLAGTGAASDTAVLLDADQTARIPDGVPGELATCIPVAAGTAWDTLQSIADEVRTNEGASTNLRDKTLLILGAGGGVGTHAIQLARHQGMKVIGATSSASKRAFVQGFGAQQVSTNQNDWLDTLHTTVSGLPSPRVDAIIDLVGGEILRTTAENLCAPGSGVVLRSLADSATAEEYGGSGVTRRRTTEVFSELVSLLGANEFTPRVSKVYSFDQAAEAFAAVEEGHVQGKVLIKIS
ncbi:NADP-dependent oxidoreductase [Corynebacterium sp. 320]|uniref:NADP-dependent oxidoreductase n=1 Tax=Corynebacterium TaxID=1716 RepID=UPI00125CB0E2|nr:MULTISPECIES: NADP-dependent oxidoreductase [Corynebacterium]KAB1502394.1 NADP-dependent oxidoreductase [Corynebacterium sp. 320]KAB1551384.1 NADP-dependent oxidoreductase [Corynebacterium sp. 321]KAB1551787.1 NADP-dependent oxidoreductase [Corynebacterium sp. 319]KAB3526001.1 NADP-dependent oxidoreductase [Corynebacterium sp. 250]KAB3538782.1 NADP-dependent oxidoreductase [Corynebacterium sp. 366]